MKYLASILFVLLAISSYSQKNKDYIPSDTASLNGGPAPYDLTDMIKYEGIDFQTYYVEMRDGVKLAVDVYLPKNLEAGTRLPTVLHQTRYWRSPDVRFPFSLFTNGLVGKAGELVKTLSSVGYALVNVDARGSGASFGSRQYPWSEDETLDGAEIVDWIISQDWSDGNVGTMGFSYSGTTAEFLVTNQHPNVKAAILAYSLFDVYEDVAYPGGVFHKFFVKNWGVFNDKLDKNKVPRGGFIVRLLVKGVRRVNTKHKVRTFRLAQKDHEKNLGVHETSVGVEFRDDVPPVGADVVSGSDVFSPFTYLDKVNASGTAIYCYSGWWDGDYQHANIKRFVNLEGEEHKMILGPWEHGGSYNCSPGNPGKSGFDHWAEFVRFFDYHLKGIDNGLYDEPKVHYFTMQEEQWKSANQWPPRGFEKTEWYFGADSSLSEMIPQEKEGFDIYKVDTTAWTGDDSRWKSVIGMLKTGDVYPDRKEQNKQLMHYTSEPLSADLEFTGHPIAHIYLSSDAPDGQIHVYLEDIGPDGSITLVTEGLLRLIFQKTAQEDPFFADVVPQRTYFREDSEPLRPEEVKEYVFDLLPTSYLFQEGHSIRISIAGADQSHFKTMFKGEPTWQIYRSFEQPSYVELPVKE